MMPQLPLLAWQVGGYQISGYAGSQAEFLLANAKSRAQAADKSGKGKPVPSDREGGRSAGQANCIASDDLRSCSK